MLYGFIFTLPDDGIFFTNFIFFEHDVKGMDTVVVGYYTTRAGYLITDNNLRLGMCYFEFIVVLIFEEEGGGSDFVDEVEFHFRGNGNHLCDEGGGLVSPGNRSGHDVSYYIISI